MRTARERILDYMSTHKSPVTVKRLAKHYIMSDSGIFRAIKELVDEGKVEIVPSKPLQYRLK